MLQKLKMMYLSKLLILLCLILSSCAGLGTFALSAGGNIASDLIMNNVDIKEYDSVNIKIVKLISGEELIGEYDAKIQKMSNPVVMIPVNNEKIAFSPWMPYAEDKDFILKEEQVLIVATPSKVIANEYSKAFGSGILIP